MKDHNKYPLAVHIFIKKKDKILLLRRYKTGYEDGKYSLVAGHVELGESVTAAAVREVEEEVGIHVNPIDLQICGVMHRKADDERIDFFTIVTKWEGDPENREPEKCDNLNWFAINNLPESIIPYILKSIKNTFSSPKNVMWYDEYGWNELHLERQRIMQILSLRGIASSEKQFSAVKNEIISVVKEIDLSFNPHNLTWIQSLEEMVVDEKIILGTPILKNVRFSFRNGAAACSVISLPVQNGEIGFKQLFSIMKKYLSKGIGIGIDISESNNPASDIVKIDKYLYKLDKNLVNNCQRPVAVMVTIQEDHPKLKEFIGVRYQKNYIKSRLNTSIFIKSRKINKTLLRAISESIYYTGEPGLLFFSSIKENNVMPQLKYISTAPCAEIALADSDMCHFCYINIAQFVDLSVGTILFNKLSDVTMSVTRFMDDIIEYTINSSQCNKNLVKENRRIGIGIAGYATALLKLGIAYDSNEAKIMLEQVVDVIAYSSKVASVELAKDRGTFPAFGKSFYNDKQWLSKKWVDRINQSKWDELKKQILIYGLRNATTIAFAPTGTSSKIIGVSASFEPYLGLTDEYNGSLYVPHYIQDAIFERYGKNVGGEIIAQILRNEIDINQYPELKTYKDIDSHTQLEITAIMQKYSDEGVSKTVNLPSNITVDDIYKCLEEAYNIGVSGISIFREQSYD